VTAAARRWIAGCIFVSQEEAMVMRKLTLALGAVSALTLGAFGCSHTLHEAKADYHQDRADRAAEHGDYYKAAREEHKADRDQVKADSAPLP
jgi:hypothetical protein